MRVTRDRSQDKNCLIGTSIHIMFEKLSMWSLLGLLLVLSTMAL